MLLLAIVACVDSVPGEPVAVPPPVPKVVTRTDPASTVDCPYGGSVVSSGLDDNANGVLEDAEIQHRSVICNPAPATPPPPVLVRLHPEPKGPNCAVGGTAVESGPDGNGNGKLDDAEVAHTDYVCGQALLTRLAPEPSGPHCVAGGLAFFIGLDHNGDGVLSDDEVQQVEYECGEILSRDVAIRSDADVAALASIRVINGSVEIFSASLTNVALPQLTLVTGAIFIEDNPQLTRVSLPALQRVDDVVTLLNDPALTTLEVPALQHVKQLKILATGILDLGGFAALQSAETGIVLRGNPALQSVRLPSLSSIGGQLEVNESPELTTLSLAVKGQLDSVVVFEDDRLQTVNLTLDSVGKVLVINGNPQLTTATVTARQLGTIAVEGNPVLSRLTLFVEGINGDVSITGTDQLRSFEFFGLFSVHGSLTLSGPFDNTLLGQVTRLLDIDGDCTVQQTHLTQLTVFRVAGVLHLIDNAELTGPISAGTLGGLELSHSPAMEVLTLDTPQIELSGNVVIVDNDALREIDLGGVTTIDGSVVVGGNDALRDVSLGGVTTIEGNVALLNSPALVTTPSSVISIGAMTLQNDPALVDLGFDHLQRVGSAIDIEGLASLQTIELPALTQAQTIAVFGNGALRHLGLTALLGPTTLFVSGNSHLPACEVDALFARVPGMHEQTGNDETATCTGPP